MLDVCWKFTWFWKKNILIIYNILFKYWLGYDLNSEAENYKICAVFVPLASIASSQVFCFISMILSSYFNNFRIFNPSPFVYVQFCHPFLLGCWILYCGFSFSIQFVLERFWTYLRPLPFFSITTEIDFKSPAVSVTRFEMEIFPVLFQIAIWNFGLCWNLLIIASS